MAAAAWNNSFWRSRFVIVTFWILSTWALEGERGERKLFSTPWGEGRRVLLNGHKLGFFKPREKRGKSIFSSGFSIQAKKGPFCRGKITKTDEGNVFPLFWRSCMAPFERCCNIKGKCPTILSSPTSILPDNCLFFTIWSRGYSGGGKLNRQRRNCRLFLRSHRSKVIGRIPSQFPVYSISAQFKL